jgi:tRNA(fMet)-specific endonuclease VapC
MKYLLDTNACIRYINGRAPLLRIRLAAVSRQDVGVSAITKAEMFYGSAKSQTPERSLEKQLEFLHTVQSIPFDDFAAAVYGKMRIELERQGTSIGQHDMLIAATCLANNLILVTHNISEFGRVAGLKMEDWEI